MANYNKEFRYILTSHPDIELFSLGTLSLGIKHIKIPVRSRQATCLYNITENDFKKGILNLIFSGLRSSVKQNTSILPDTVKVCSEEAVVNGKLLSFRLQCCSTPEMCDEVLADSWQEFLIYIITSLNFIGFLYVANLVPRYLYADKFSYINFYHELDKISKFRVVNKSDDDTETVAELDTDTLEKVASCHTMTSLRDAIKGESYTIKGLWFKVPVNRLVSKEYLPISLFIFLYQRLVECTCNTYRGHALSPLKLKPFSAMADHTDQKSFIDNTLQDFNIRICCELPICNPENRVFMVRFPRWNKLLHVVMVLVSSLILATPWIIIHALDNQTPEGKRGQFAQEKQLIYSPSFYAFNLLRFLKVHAPELSFACMIIYLFCTLLLSIILQNDREESDYVGIQIRAALRNAKSRWDSGVTKSSRLLVSLFLPFKILRNYGLLALIMWPFWIAIVCPFTVLIILLGNSPTVNIFLRLFIIFMKDILNIFLSREIRNNPLKSAKKCSVYILLICLLFIVHFFVFALVSLVVNMVAYTLVGVIVTANATVRYTAFVVLIVLNARDCFLGVEKRYAVFNEKLQETVLSKILDEIKKLAKCNKDVQTNAAFKINVEPDTCEPKPPKQGLWQDLAISDRNKIIWKPRSVVQFLDNDDKVYLSEKFFFDACYMDYYGCPGDFASSLFFAVRQVFLITAFLTFVAFTLIAYGGLEENNSSGLLVTLATGLLPLFVRRFFSKPIPELSLDTDDFNFQNTLDSLIHKFTEYWEVIDLDIEKFDKNAEPVPNVDTETNVWLKLGSDSFLQLAINTEELYGSGKQDIVNTEGMELAVVDPAERMPDNDTEGITE